MLNQKDIIENLDDLRQDWLEGGGLSYCCVERLIKSIYKSIGTCNECKYQTDNSLCDMGIVYDNTLDESFGCNKFKKEKIMKELTNTEKIIEHTLTRTRVGSKAWEMMVTAGNKLDEWDDAKLNRWIVYAHCLLVAEGAITINKIADEIRDLIE
jgi:hypothetical protein